MVKFIFGIMKGQTKKLIILVNNFETFLNSLFKDTKYDDIEVKITKTNGKFIIE